MSTLETPPVGRAWFRDVTAEVGLAPVPGFAPQGTSVVSGDLDGDGFPDLITSLYQAYREPDPKSRTRHVLMNRPAKSGTGRIFVDETERSGLLATRDGVGGRGGTLVSLGDLDGDGDLDAVTCPDWGDDPDKVVDGCAAFLNDGTGRFSLSAASDLDKDVYYVPSSTLFDFDRDGVLDFWPGTVGAWFGKAKNSAPRLFRGNGDGTFVNIAASVGMPKQRDRGQNRLNFGIVACDLDDDGNPDMLTANYGRQPNEVFMNLGGRVEEKGVALGIAYDDNQDYSDDVSYQCFCVANPESCPTTVPAPPRGLPLFKFARVDAGRQRCENRSWRQHVLADLR